ncbi:MAG TPA: FecR domain-containing protein [Steroidobacteraceae bacterium]|nr:FecR domain-containing protein [Steroidobacteraceae bacterium]
MTVPLSNGAILQLPATVRTGADGAVTLRQGNSTFAAASNTELEIPQSAAEDGLVERIVQIRGNAFYSIGKRTGTRLRVEAPYLVAVIKGTQFNVAAQEDSTTIALFEGHLEVRASDESDVVDLDAGEIAIRRRNDVSISVLRLNAAARDARRNQELAARPQADSPDSNSDVVAARNDGNTRVDVDASVTTPTVRGPIVETLQDGNTALAAKTTVAVSDVVTADVAADAKVDLPAGSASVDVGASTSVGEIASVGAGASTAVDLSAGTVAANGSVGADVGSVSADVGTAAAVDVPAGAVDVGASATVAAGTTPVVDVGAAAAVDAPAGTVDVGLGSTVAGTDVDASVGVDAGAGNVGADVNVGGVTVGVDAGSGGLDVDLGLGGLLGRKHRN